MKKNVIAFVGLPLVFAAVGYGGGQIMPTAAETQSRDGADHVTAADPATLVLDKLADEAAAQHDESAAQHVVRLGRMSMPIYRASSVTYVVSEIAVQVPDLDALQKFNDAENISRLRDVALASLHDSADRLSLTGAVINSPELSERMEADLREKFGEVIGKVFFLSMFQTDVPRS